ncbi:hypothetical protein V6N13_011358 [Hibiscus sabdariffa]
MANGYQLRYPNSGTKMLVALTYYAVEQTADLAIVTDSAAHLLCICNTIVGLLAVARRNPGSVVPVTRRLLKGINILGRQTRGGAPVLRASCLQMLPHDRSHLRFGELSCYLL